MDRVETKAEKDSVVVSALSLMESPNTSNVVSVREISDETEPVVITAPVQTPRVKAQNLSHENSSVQKTEGANRSIFADTIVRQECAESGNNSDEVSHIASTHRKLSTEVKGYIAGGAGILILLGLMALFGPVAVIEGVVIVAIVVGIAMAAIIVFAVVWLLYQLLTFSFL